jgi:hypothetical protein
MQLYHPQQYLQKKPTVSDHSPTHHQIARNNSRFHSPPQVESTIAAQMRTEPISDRLQNVEQKPQLMDQPLT